MNIYTVSDSGRFLLRSALDAMRSYTLAAIRMAHTSGTCAEAANDVKASRLLGTMIAQRLAANGRNAKYRGKICYDPIATNPPAYPPSFTKGRRIRRAAKLAITPIA
jgi:hypothetical protein